MLKFDHDIVVAGGGIAGLAAAAAFGNAGLSVLCVDPAPPVTDRAAEGADMRSTAFLQPSQGLLEEIGLWDRLAEHATPLQTMRIVDAGGDQPAPRVTRDFDAADISDRPFGWNLPNWLLRREFAAHLDALDGVEFRTGTAAMRLFTRETEARIGMSDGSRVRARLVVAADGRNSAMRQTAGIDVRTTRFGQKALAFAVTHDAPHDNVSTEIHRTGGPFTLVPLPDHDGWHSSAVVWMEAGPRAEALAAMDVVEFEAAMTERSAGLFGPLRLVTRRALWPIIAQEATRLSAQRMALVAEAAHVVPPIGAQGLNMSLKDIAALRDLAVASPDTLGDRAMLDAYHNSRIADIRARVAGITALNRISMLSPQPLRDLRAQGLDALYAVAPLRRTLMQLGLGARG
ncbi:UbiH/UbiF family hydroxylase [Citreimonas salinaria]|uniref:UbiH/UbiF family hydroxylase n=1 Tax=Citreimonas salinaria TaxID=321339 RepID=UPI001FE19142|nr:UbiH/UbiF family hydroxylase [Citreimonas salinaria]